jgi:crossover junction endodeoxyribonuclease RuvC
MRILGIDPGTANTGYGLIESKTKIKYLDHGIIQTTPDDCPGERLRQINNNLARVIRKYKPDFIAIEKVYFFVNKKSVIKVSQAKGSLLLTAAKKKIPVKEYSPITIKSVITGNGRAKKEEVGEFVRKILKLKEIPKPDHAADALAAAITYVEKLKES